ncbi:hypothetical protein HDF23_005483 [Mucilaginibacter lappiensis]|uniref:Uncharacterized protein n=1 Tax=Mucilaginibacter lappiensis TaxID=354630 RepID=A0ABR6PSH7_9SPHI|nr:hypothetical protein [Mucilaginibacter lappiensis]MBB6112705.1 hypothetical protein [Mucilaginibacter lappiensis]
MGDITIEKADYIIAHYTDLLTLAERKALRHHVSTIKLEGTADGRLTRLYLKTGWLTDDPLILNYLTEGYIRFTLNCAERILKDNPEKIFFNLCPHMQKAGPYAVRQTMPLVWA